MNVKFKMPKFGRKLTGSGMLRELLLTTLGTAIGVGLTFFVNNMVEKNHQRAAQRETAIMAVCDIDEIVQGLKDEIQLEDSLFKVTMYVATHQELIDSLSMDTLDMAFKYLYDDPMVVKPWTADTKENAFNSGIDARMNLGNNQFYDNVQSCYYVRRSLMKVMADAPMFRRPLSKDAYEDFLYELPPADIYNDGVPLPDARRHVMKQVFAQKSTTLYIKRYFPRKNAYQDAVTKLEGLNRENKLLMDITDEDIEKYIRQNSENVSQQAIADLIIGTWLLNKDTIAFHEDNTFERTWVAEFQAEIQLEKDQKEVLVLVPTAFCTKGQWTLNGDTLTYDCDNSSAEMLSFDFDTSNFPQSTLERLKDSLEFDKEMIRRSILENFRQQTMKFDEVVSFDKSGNTMVWTHEESTPAGNKQTTSMQLYRKPE
jgi:hypothetical protein